MLIRLLGCWMLASVTFGWAWARIFSRPTLPIERPDGRPSDV